MWRLIVGQMHWNQTGQLDHEHRWSRVALMPLLQVMMTAVTATMMMEQVQRALALKDPTARMTRKDRQNLILTRRSE